MDEAIGIGIGVLLILCVVVLVYLGIRAIEGIDFDDDDPAAPGAA